jgi:hypothetical protein
VPLRRHHLPALHRTDHGAAEHLRHADRHTHRHRHPGHRGIRLTAPARRRGVKPADPLRALRARLGGRRHALQPAPEVRARRAAAVGRCPVACWRVAARRTWRCPLLTSRPCAPTRRSRHWQCGAVRRFSSRCADPRSAGETGEPEPPGVVVLEIAGPDERCARADGSEQRRDRRADAAQDADQAAGGADAPGRQLVGAVTARCGGHISRFSERVALVAGGHHVSNARVVAGHGATDRVIAGIGVVPDRWFDPFQLVPFVERVETSPGTDGSRSRCRARRRPRRYGSS